MEKVKLRLTDLGRKDLQELSGCATRIGEIGAWICRIRGWGAVKKTSFPGSSDREEIERFMIRREA